MSENGDIGNGVSRRKILKSGGALAGINLVGVVPASASPLTETHIVEVGVEHSLETSIGEATLPIMHLDTESNYRVDLSTKSALTNPYADDHAQSVSALNNNDFVVQTHGSQSTDGQVFTEQTRELSYSLEPDFRSSYRLQTLEPVDQHTVSVKPKGQSAVVDAPGVNARVPEFTANDGPRRKKGEKDPVQFRTKLPTKEVKVEITEILDERVSNPDVEKPHRPRKKRKEERTVEVQPELCVRNLGKVSIQKGKPV